MNTMPAFANVFVHCTELVDVTIFNSDNEVIDEVHEVTADQSAQLVACVPPHAVNYNFELAAC